jgi:hypothetical protein
VTAAASQNEGNSTEDTMAQLATYLAHVMNITPSSQTEVKLRLFSFSLTAIERRYSDSLRAGRSGDRIPVGVRLSPSVQTGPGAHPAFYTTGTGSFSGVKRPGPGVDHPLPSSAEDKEKVELYLYSPFGPSWPVIG